MEVQPINDLRIGVFYDDGGEKFGGDIAYTYNFGNRQLSQQQESTADFSPDLFSPILREYSQRIISTTTLQVVEVPTLTLFTTTTIPARVQRTTLGLGFMTVSMPITVATATITDSGGIILQDGRGYRLAKNGERTFWDEMRFDFWHLAAPAAAKRRHRLSATPADILSWHNPQERADLARRLMLPMNALFLSLLALLVAHSRQRMGARQGFGIGVMLFLLNLNIFYFAVEQTQRGTISLPLAFVLPPLATFAAALLLKARARA